MNANRKLYVCCLATAGLMACGPSLRVSRYDPEVGPPTGAVYYLPAARLNVQLELELTSTLPLECVDNVQKCAGEVKGRVTSLKLGTEAVPDLTAGFVLEHRASPVLNSNFSGEFNARGELVSSANDSSNKAVEAAAAGLDALGDVAKTLAEFAMGSGPPPDGVKVLEGTSTKPEALLKQRQDALKPVLLPRLQRKTYLERALKEAAAEAEAASKREKFVYSQANLEKLELSGKVIKAIETELQALDERQTKVTKIAVTCQQDLKTVPSEPLEISAEKPTCPALNAVYSMLPQQSWKELPELTVTLEPLAGSATGDIAADWKKLTEGRSGSATGTSSVNGYVYRIPAWYQVTAEATTTSGGQTRIEQVATQALALPQFGHLAAVAVDRKDLHGDRTLKVELQEGVGSLKKVTHDVKVLDFKEAAALVEKTTDLMDARRDAELERLKAETELLEAQLDNLKAREEVESQQNGKK